MACLVTPPRCRALQPDWLSVFGLVEISYRKKFILHCEIKKISTSAKISYCDNKLPH